jgi:predicted DNA-binding transcriptional regulator AlpA
MAQFLTPKAVCERIALSRATLDRLVAADKFPAPIRLTERRLAFDAARVEAWMIERMENA